MSDFGVNVTINSGSHKLELLGRWGGPWDVEPTDIEANQSKTFTLKDNDRAGIWYRAIDPSTQNEIGFVNMSFTCPKLSDNSAEGTSSDSSLWVSAGLQTYSGSGHPLNITYKVGESNKACWDSGNSDNKKTTCGETTFADRRALITIKNPKSYQLKFGNYWNYDSSGSSNWYWEPSSSDVPPPNCKRTVVLKNNDRAGICLRVLDTKGENELGFANAVFTCPKSSSNSAEGSPSDSQFLISAGLQTYDKSGTPVSFEYQIGNSNNACWSSGSKNDNKFECDQTTFKDRRALILVENTFPNILTFSDYWNDNGSGSSNWYIEPNADDTIPPNCRRYFVLKDNDRAGVFYNIGYLEYHLSFTCPKSSSNSAEGSPYAGLQSYSEHGTPVTFTYKVGTINLACWNNGNYNDGKIVCPQTNVQAASLDQWMAKVNGIKRGFKNLSLNQLFLPGGHDAACYNNSAIATRWVQTQELNFKQQLEKGIRYLDLRPSYNLDSFEEDHYHGFHHGSIPVAARLNDLIDQVYEFYESNWTKRQNEIVIFDFTHFNKYTNRLIQKFINILHNSKLNKYLIPAGTSTASLQGLWGATPNGRVIASVNFDPSPYSNIQNIWKGRQIFATGWDGTKFWPNTDDEADLISFLNGIVNNSPYGNSLWALQDILTPGATSSVYSLSSKAHAAFFDVAGQAWVGKANIVIQDYFDERTTVEAIIQNLNRS